MLFTAACIPSLRGSQPLPTFPIVRIYDTHAARFVSFPEFATTAAKADLVFFGELHDDPATHAAELAVLASVGERRAPMVLSLEMFERDVQAQLDGYLAGRTSEKDFLAASRPWDRYVTDYRPLVELARVRGWPVIAANIPRPLASAVSRRGLQHFDTLNARDRAFTATENVCPRDDQYYRNFVGLMGGAANHGATPGGDSAAARASLDRVYEAQCVKDEAMAESIAAAYKAAGKGALVLHVNGSFHSDYRLGTVSRTQRRLPGAKVLVLTSVPLGANDPANPQEHKDKADYLIFTRVVK